VTLLDLVKLGIEGAWAQKKTKSTLKSLDIPKNMSDKAEHYKKAKWLLDTLEEESVADSIHIIQSLHTLINTYGSKEISKKPLSELKSYFEQEFQ